MNLLQFMSFSLLAVPIWAATCTVEPSSNGADDAPAIKDAFAECGQGGTVTFLNETYNIETVMNITGLNNCVVELYGTLLWSTNTTYWLNNSMPIGYQNQTTAFFFGGHNVTFKGFGYGTFDGNGQTWYNLVAGISNYPNRPHMFTISNTTDSVFENLRFVQSQMWTVDVINSSSILLQDIYVNNTSSSSAAARNTDGSNTIYANNITYLRWDVTNGDDAIAVKANSTNIVIKDSTFRKGQGLAIGSIGQYLDTYEIIENVTATNITSVGTAYAGYIKTWTGVQEGYPPNGGGGGLGYAKNIVLHNFTLVGARDVFYITQCTSFAGYTGNCDTSLFQIENLDWRYVSGTVVDGVESVASMQCSGDAPCQNITITGIDIQQENGTVVDGYYCHDIGDHTGFDCQ